MSYDFVRILITVIIFKKSGDMKYTSKYFCIK